MFIKIDNDHKIKWIKYLYWPLIILNPFRCRKVNILCSQTERGGRMRQKKYQKWLQNAWIFLVSNHWNISNFVIIVSLFPSNEAHNLNIYRAEFSNYNLSPDFLNLALVTFSFNFYKNRLWLQNHIDWISSLALTHFVSLQIFSIKNKNVSYPVKYKTIGY